MSEPIENAIEQLSSAVSDVVRTAITVDDFVLKTKEPIVFQSDPQKGPYGQGLQWKGAGVTKQFIYRANPDRVWSSESIDLLKDKAYHIDNVEVLSKTGLGASVRESSITTLGTVKNLRTQGDLVIDEYIYYNSTLDALGIGTDSPNGKLSIATLDGEFIIDTEPKKIKLGSWTTSDLDLITDNNTRISVKANGDVEIANKLSVNKIGVKVNHIDENVDLAVAGNIQFKNKLFSVGLSEPDGGTFKKGDIVWNEDPKPTGYVGWICVRSGTPGEWKPFGSISK